jgi:CubicO group peptidase (beta-lactamase class C family)
LSTGGLMKITILLVLTILIFYGFGFCEIKVEKNFENQLEAFIDKMMKTYDVPGIAIGIVKDNKIVFKKGYGLSNIKTGQTVNSRTLFKIASVSKLFTSIAVMQLWERRLIHLDDPVSRHVPYFHLKDEQYRFITIRMLLNHTSGIPTMYKAEFGYENPEFDDQALKRYIISLSNRKMEFSPGEKYAYSNHGYALLAALIECVSKMPFEQYIKKNILEPVGMKNSLFYYLKTKTPDIAVPHVLGEDFRFAVAEYIPVNRWAASSGGLFSSIDEMCNWLMVSLNKGVFKKKRILTENSYNKMWKVSSTKNTRTGLGWFVDKWLGTTLISHPGGGLGYSAECCLLPGHKMAVVVLCNTRKSPVWNITSAAFRLMLGKKLPKVSAPLDIQMLDLMKDKGINSAIRFYREKREKLPADEFWLNQLLILGHRIIHGKHPDKLEIARKIFELNLEYYPKSAHAYDFLAEAYLKLALKNFHKALELDPTIWGARDIIDKFK